MPIDVGPASSLTTSTRAVLQTPADAAPLGGPYPLLRRGAGRRFTRYCGPLPSARRGNRWASTYDRSASPWPTG
jgi:hypothetical protein